MLHYLYYFYIIIYIYIVIYIYVIIFIYHLCILIIEIAGACYKCI